MAARQIFPGWKAYCLAFDLPEPTVEHEFDVTGSRRFRLDVSWPSVRVAIEVQGGIAGNLPSHASYANRRRDMEKINLAQTQGWVVLQFEWKDVMSGNAAVMVREAIEARRKELHGGKGKEAGTPKED